MIRRTTNPKHEHWEYYGGRGIKVCKRWLKFPNFLADMGERPTGLTLDRKRVNGNYTPSNCRWATKTQQLANRRDYRRQVNGRSLASEQAREIRFAHNVMGATRKALASQYGISTTHVWRIATGRSWYK